VSVKRKNHACDIVIRAGQWHTVWLLGRRVSFFLQKYAIMAMRTPRITANRMYPTSESARLVFMADGVPMELTPPPAERRPVAIVMQIRIMLPILFARGLEL
jgi:hypothetical protein